MNSVWLGPDSPPRSGPKPVVLYSIPGCPYSTVAEQMLRFKGIRYRRRDLLPGLHRHVLRVLGFPGRTVPAFRIGEWRGHSTAEIATVIDELEPGRPLIVMSDSERQRQVEQIVIWACGVLGPVKEYLLWWGVERDRPKLKKLFASARLSAAGSLARKMLPVLSGVVFRFDPSRPEEALAVLSTVPGTLNEIDAFIDSEIVDNGRPNAADFHLAALTQLLMAFDDLRPAIMSRPAGHHAVKYCSPFPVQIASASSADRFGNSFMATRNAILAGEKTIPQSTLPDSSCGLPSTPVEIGLER